MLTAPTDQIQFQAESEPTLPSFPRAAWRQRVHHLIGRFLAPYADLPPNLFATDEYLLLSGSVRRLGLQDRRPFD